MKISIDAPNPTRWCPIVICLFAVVLVGAFPAIGLSQTKEPPQTFKLLVNGQAHEIEARKALQLELTGSTKIELIPNPNRKFKYGGLEITYPNSYAFEAELDADTYNWNLDGSNVVIMVFAFPDETLGHKLFAESICTNFEKSEYKAILNTFGTGDQATTLKGTLINATIASQKLTQEVFEIPTDAGTRFLIVQDSLNDFGKHTQECRNTMTLLRRDFKITGTEVLSNLH